jgi:hypothetical protein
MEENKVEKKKRGRKMGSKFPNGYKKKETIVISQAK